jgi:hypothetical protein
MKRFFSTLLICGFLMGSVAEAAGSAGGAKAAQKSAVKKRGQQKRKNGKVRKAAGSRAKKVRKN